MSRSASATKHVRFLSDSSRSVGSGSKLVSFVQRQFAEVFLVCNWVMGRVGVSGKTHVLESWDCFLLSWVGSP